MGRMKMVTARCSVCGHIETHEMLVSDVLLPCTLDFCLPTPMAGHLLMECPKCDYVAKDITASLGLDASILQSEDYFLGDEVGYESPGEQKFARFALLCSLRGEHYEAGTAYLYAAKISGGEYETNLSKSHKPNYYRQEAVKELLKVSPAQREEREQVQLMILDGLRRLGRFIEGLKYASSLEIETEEYQMRFQFEQKLLKVKDKHYYTLRDMEHKFFKL